MILLICSLQDLPSRNMREQLFGMREWDHLGSDGKNDVHMSGDMAMVTTPDLHIRADDVDMAAETFGIHADDVIFMSRHKAASAIPTLTVHPIGNYNDADFGGRSRTLVKASPALMTESLRALVRADVDGYRTSFEVTHHGPYLGRPTFFIEIGSDESTWGDRHAAGILAEVLDRLHGNDHPNAVGLGGGHYAPRFSEIVMTHRINFGHMIPGYAFEGRDDDDILRMTKAACDATDTGMVYMHRKSMKTQEASRIAELLSSDGYEMISSKDLDPISGNR